MKNGRRIILLVVFMILGLCISCTDSNGSYGKRIDEDLTTTNIPDDNYRNYYEIFVRSFYDSNGDGIGDLRGVIEKLDYISDLGFTGIWLMPINSSSSTHKYDVTDYYTIDKSYGTMDDLEELIEECHKRNIKLILDLVLNHSGLGNKMFTKAKAAYEKVRAGQALEEDEIGWDSFYCFYGSKEEIPSGKVCQQVSNKGYYYECNFSTSMPEFNLDNELVHQEFQNIIKYYLDKGVDGFRLDAVKYYYVESNAKSIEFLKKINQWVKAINPNAYIVGECWDSQEIITQYYGSGCDSFFNFTTSINNSTSGVLNSLNLDGKMLNRYYDTLISNIEMAGNGIPAPFLDNHDMPRYTSSASPNKSKFQYGLLSMLNGSTFTYYGDEIGMVGSNNGSNPDENVRIPILWGEGNGLGDCNTLTAATENNYYYGTVKDQLEDETSILNYYKKCLLLRNQNPEIARGNITLVEMDREEKKLLFITKEYNGSKIGIVINFSPTDDLNVDIQSAGFNEVVGQLVVDCKTYIGLQKNNSILLPPYSIAIVK